MLLPESNKSKGFIALSYTETDTRELLAHIADSEISEYNFFLQGTQSPSESTAAYEQI